MVLYFWKTLTQKVGCKGWGHWSPELTLCPEEAWSAGPGKGPAEEWGPSLWLVWGGGPLLGGRFPCLLEANCTWTRSPFFTYRDEDEWSNFRPSVPLTLTRTAVCPLSVVLIGMDRRRKRGKKLRQQPACLHSERRAPVCRCYLLSFADVCILGTELFGRGPLCSHENDEQPTANKGKERHDFYKDCFSH